MARTRIERDGVTIDVNHPGDGLSARLTNALVNIAEQVAKSVTRRSPGENPPAPTHLRPAPPPAPPMVCRNELIGIEFLDGASGRIMSIRPTGDGPWLCWKHPDGQWVTVREPTENDLDAIEAAAISAGIVDP